MSSIIVYGKNNCPNCDNIKNKLIELNIDFEYIKDDIKIMDIAQDLHKNGKLIETVAPIVLKNGEQIKHNDIEKLL